MSRKRILFLGSQMETGGAQRVLLDHAGWFQSQGYETLAAFLYDKEDLQASWQSQASFPILDLQARRPSGGALRNALSLLGGMLRLWRVLRTFRPNALETFTHHSSLIGLPLARLAGVPVCLATHHGKINRMPVWMEGLHAWMVNRGWADALVCVSERVRREAVAEGVHPKKLRTIANGIRLPQEEPGARLLVRAELGLPADALLVLCAGRLTYQKAHTFLVQAAPEILRSHPAARIYIAGEGPLRAELEAEIQTLGVGDYVHLPGIRRDLARWMQAADVFLLPSRWEGMPLVLLEAMACGCPVAASRVVGIEDVIVEEVNGLLFPAEDATALAQAALRLLSSPALRSSLGAAARQTILERYTLDASCSLYAGLLDPARNGQVQNE